MFIVVNYPILLLSFLMVVISKKGETESKLIGMTKKGGGREGEADRSLIYPFLPSFSKYLLIACYKPDILEPGPRDPGVTR